MQYASRQLDGADCAARADYLANTSDILIGPVISACTVRMARAAAPLGLPLLSISKVADLSNKTIYGTMYRVATSTKFYVDALAFLVQLAETDCITIIYDVNANVHMCVQGVAAVSHRH